MTPPIRYIIFLPYAHAEMFGRLRSSILPMASFAVEESDGPAVKQYNEAYAPFATFVEHYKQLSDHAEKQEAAYSEAIKAVNEQVHFERYECEERGNYGFWDLSDERRDVKFKTMDEELEAFKTAYEKACEKIRKTYGETSGDMLERAKTLPHELHERLQKAWLILQRINDHLEPLARSALDERGFRIRAKQELERQAQLLKDQAECQAQLLKEQAEQQASFMSLCHEAQLLASTAAMQVSEKQEGEKMEEA